MSDEPDPVSQTNYDSNDEDIMELRDDSRDDESFLQLDDDAREMLQMMQSTMGEHTHSPGLEEKHATDLKKSNSLFAYSLNFDWGSTQRLNGILKSGRLHHIHVLTCMEYLQNIMPDGPTAISPDDHKRLQAALGDRFVSFVGNRQIPHLDVPGAKLCKILEENKQIDTLYIVGMMFGGPTPFAKLLGRTLFRNRGWLHSVHLEGCFTGLQAAQANKWLPKAIKGSPNLVHLSLPRYDHSNHRTFQRVLRHAFRHEKLESLNLEGCTFFRGDMSFIAKYIKENRNMKRLNLSRCNIDHTVLPKLIKAMLKNTNMYEIKMEGTKIETKDTGYQELLRLLERNRPKKIKEGKMEKKAVYESTEVFLKRMRLDRYLKVFMEKKIKTIELLMTTEEDELHKILNGMGLKKGHISRIQRQVKDIRGEEHRAMFVRALSQGNET